jgi:deoxycytidine triphosphate deaminase
LTDISEPEKELVSRARGKRLAEAWRKSPRELNIPDSLLNSQAITDVVQATGAISPFYIGGGRKARLKKATYEGRAGSKAYTYRERNAPERIFDVQTDDFLVVPKNSIVFVESDLDFRLPDFLALRFNLQIQHVHRGLLLGTGPLVDPGFWGKLCIPLHNLTDEDYAIPKNEGLIWVEFTKTTLASNQVDHGRAALEATATDTKGHWEIEALLDKAASQYRSHKVPIRSSLPTMFGDAELAVKKSAEDAESARTDAKAALDVAQRFGAYNLFAMIAAAVGFAAICITAMSFLSGLASRNEDLADKTRLDAHAAQSSIDRHVREIDALGLQPLEVRASLPAMRAALEQQQRELAELRQEVDLILSERRTIEEIRHRQLAPPATR